MYVQFSPMVSRTFGMEYIEPKDQRHNTNDKQMIVIGKLHLIDKNPSSGPRISLECPRTSYKFNKDCVTP